MREIDVKPLLNYEGNILQNLLRFFNIKLENLSIFSFRLLRYKDISCDNYLKFISVMEKKISDILLRNGSYFKFLFKVKKNIPFFLKTIL